MEMIFPPNIIKKQAIDSNTIIFLGGSIDENNSKSWRRKVANFFNNIPNLILLNPRALKWNSTTQEKYVDADFFQQVKWETKAQEISNIIIYHFTPESNSPITLMELGEFGSKQNNNIIKVSCPLGFWKKGNVEIFCDKHGIQLYENLEELLESLSYLKNI